MNFGTDWYQFLLESGALLVASVALSICALFLSVRLARWKWRRTSNARAEILNLKPFYRKSIPHRTRFVQCEFQFHAKRIAYEGQAAIPLSFFFPGSTSVMIAHDSRIDLPVLYLSEEKRIVGQEAIEHCLLEKVTHLNVRYLLRDPSRNFIARQPRRKTTVKKRPTIS